MTRISDGVWRIVKEVARHLLRRPVVGIAAAARTREGRWLLVRRADSGAWALPGGTLEWGETLRNAITREIAEETGAQVIELGEVSGVYSDPSRDPRFHAVTVVVSVLVTEPREPPLNHLEIAEVRSFADDELPERWSHGMRPMLDHARSGKGYWE
jgi:8-oxo-dGTP diphosphatase